MPDTSPACLSVSPFLSLPWRASQRYRCRLTPLLLTYTTIPIRRPRYETQQTSPPWFNVPSEIPSDQVTASISARLRCPCSRSVLGGPPCLVVAPTYVNKYGYNQVFLLRGGSPIPVQKATIAVFANTCIFPIPWVGEPPAPTTSPPPLAFPSPPWCAK